MRVWRLAANDSHLYPGARLTCQEPEGASRFQRGDAVVVEFSDGAAACGTLSSVSPDQARLRLDGYRTTRGAVVGSRMWRIAPGDRPGAIRVQARIP